MPDPFDLPRWVSHSRVLPHIKKWMKATLNHN